MTRAVRVAAAVALLSLGIGPRAPAAPPARERASAGLADRVARVRVELEGAAGTVETVGEARDRIQHARGGLVAAGGDPAWLDPFSERARSIEWRDPAGLLTDAAGTLAVVEGELRAFGPERARDREASERTDAERLARLLADPEFQHVREGAADPGRLERLWAWLRGRFFEAFASRGMSTVAGAMLWILKALLGVSLLFGAVWWVRRARLLWRTRTASQVGGPGNDAPSPSPATPATEALLRDGCFREALRAVHLDTLGELARRGQLSGSVARTHWDELRSLAARTTAPPWLDGFAALGREFDRVWYGAESVDATRFELFAVDAGRLLASAGAGETR